MKFLCVRKKTIIAVLLCVLCVVAFCGVYFPVKATSAPKPLHTIVIDAGHGGQDGGAVGKNTGVSESYLNLQYALMLQRICEGYGFEVVQTRPDMNGLYSMFAKNKKRSEMEKRISIIENAKPDVVVSIHMNSFTSSAAEGSQVYYGKDKNAGQSLAECVTTSLHKNVKNAKSTAKVGDFYVLNYSACPTILVECGYLSNPDEEILLQDEKYMQTFCYHLFCGILTYFNFK